MGPGGELFSDRNTPDRYNKQSPAKIVFGHDIKDFMSVLPQKYSPNPAWCITMEDRERALKYRHTVAREKWSVGTKKLEVGNTVILQNQYGNKPLKWDRTGTVIELGEIDKYLVRVHGSNRVTIRNRKFLRKMTPFQVSSPALRFTPSVKPQLHRPQSYYSNPAGRGQSIQLAVAWTLVKPGMAPQNQFGGRSQGRWRTQEGNSWRLCPHPSEGQGGCIRTCSC